MRGGVARVVLAGSTVSGRPATHQVLKGNTTSTMPRKSSSFSSKESQDCGSIDQYVTTETRKRKGQPAGAGKTPSTAAEQDSERSPMSAQVSKRRQQFHSENQWIPISNSASPTSTVVTSSLRLVTTSMTHVTKSTDDGNRMHSTQGVTGRHANGVTSYRFQNYFTTPLSEVKSPLPQLAWADSGEVWQVMLRKETNYHRDSAAFARHPCLQPHMRAILLDWIIEVCEVYKLHRQTFYLAVDFVDRYLSSRKNVLKTHLQLLGITALFIAAKLEEIYPPKINDFAYVTDGACSESDITNQELIVLKELNWKLNPVTVINWLTAYMQLLELRTSERLACWPASLGSSNQADSSPAEPDKPVALLVPNFSGHAFVQLVRLTDLCMLDVGCLQYSYSVIATSALYHQWSDEVALALSGYGWGDIAACVEWMTPFALAVRQKGVATVKDFDVAPEDVHNIQSHYGDLHLLETVRSTQTQGSSSFDRFSPDVSGQAVPDSILTPPPSHEKNSNSVAHL